MTPTPKRAEPLPPADDAAEPLELTSRQTSIRRAGVRPGAMGRANARRARRGRPAGPRHRAERPRGACGLAYTAWSAGRTLAGQPLTSPAVAQWLAVAAGPLALLGLAWLIFGRTRRKEAERFTRSVITMRSEARSLEALLEVLSQRITDSRTELTVVAQQSDAAWRRDHRANSAGSRANSTAAARNWCDTARRSTAPRKPRGSILRSCSTTCRAPRKRRAPLPTSLR